MLLPDSTFVPVHLQKPVTIRRFWCAGEDGEAAINCAAYSAIDEDESIIFQPGVTVVGKGELYGGAGLAANAGGVRVANIGEIQYKGTGVNCLAGKTTDKWHRHGACSLQDAIKEAILSRIFDAACPHGAVQSLAVIDLGTHFATEIGQDKLPGSAPRALLARPVSVRLAHFFRSSFQDTQPSLVSQDLKKMREALPMLSEYLRKSIKSNDKRSRSSLIDGIFHLYSKYSDQIASLQSSRLVHGSLIPSNLSVDGKLLDFTTSTAISIHRPILVALGGASSEHQFEQVLHSLLDLVFYLTKFGKTTELNFDSVVRLTEDLSTELRIYHEEALIRSRLEIFGFSKDEISSLSSTEIFVLWRPFNFLFNKKSSDYIYYGGDEHQMPAPDGLFNLGAIATYALTCAFNHSYSGLNTMMLRLGLDSNKLCDVVDGVFKLLQKTPSITDHPGAEYEYLARIVRVWRKSADISPLYRRALDGEINDIAQSNADIAEYIDGKIGRWVNVFDCHQDHIETQHWLTANKIRVTNSFRFFTVESEITPTQLLKRIDREKLTAFQTSILGNFEKYFQ